MFQGASVDVVNLAAWSADQEISEVEKEITCPASDHPVL